MQFQTLFTRFGFAHNSLCSTPLAHLLPSSLPAAWLEVSDSSSSSSPSVYLQSTSSWLPELRSLLLGGNNVNGTGYAALQTVANWKSLQTLDLGNNDLVGSVEDSLSTFFYCDGSGTGCGGNVPSVAAPRLRVLKLDGNKLTGERVIISLKRACRRMRQTKNFR